QIRKMADHVLFVEKGSVVRSKAVDKAFSNTSRSEKFQLLGKIMQIRTEDAFRIASVLIGKDIKEVVITGEEQYEIGDQVIVTTQATTPS
ncbi:MAG: hypothetical protein AAF519_12345, partial [Bacteroidota bacterium]